MGGSGRIAALRFVVGLLAICVFFVVLSTILRATFAVANVDGLRSAPSREILEALQRGWRFQFAALAFVLAPVLVLYGLVGVARWRLVTHLLVGYCGVLGLLLTLIALADLQYFEEAGKHLTYEATMYLNLSALTIFTGAFAMHPVLSSLSLLACLLTGALGGWLARHAVRRSVSAGATPRSAVFVVVLPLCIATTVTAVTAMQARGLRLGYASFSANPYVNGLTLDPVYAVIRTALTPSERPFTFQSEAVNVETVRRLLLMDTSRTPADGRFPLRRTSPGTERGNRKNVVLFLLESWSGKEVGVLGGPPGVTPFFDQLSRQGLFFDNFYATGVRTAEGMFSILASFPNQPVTPIMARSEVTRVHWRPLSEILAEAGYHPIFVHGRDLTFDDMDSFLRAHRFETIIDRRGFPPWVPTNGRLSWPGYDDEQVFIHADQVFSQQGDRPFFGVVYTMNTHTPFNSPAGFPRMYAGTDPGSRYLNALHYSDYALKVFFEKARTRRYFEDTIFLFVADHARAIDTLNLRAQHHIPFLIYGPGAVEPGVRHVVGSQLDILPTVLGLLDLKTDHAAWGRDLRAAPDERGFAIVIAGGDVRWHEGRYLLSDGLSDRPPLLCDVAADPQCQRNVWSQHEREGTELQQKLRAVISLSQRLLVEDRVFPRATGVGRSADPRPAS